MTDNEKDLLRYELRDRIRAREVILAKESMSPQQYARACVEAMYEVAIDVLVEIKSEASRGTK